MSIVYNRKSDVHVSSGYKRGDNPIRNFSTLSFTIDNIKSIGSLSQPVQQRIIVSAKIFCMRAGGWIYQKDITEKVIVDSVTADSISYKPISDEFALVLSGFWDCRINFTDGAGDNYSFFIGGITIEPPSWEKTITVNLPPPAIGSNGKAVVDYIKVFLWDYDNGTWSATYDTYYSQLDVTDIQSNSWTFKWTFDDTQVSRDADKQRQADADVKVELAYKHYDTEEKEYRRAFFSTTRNQNYTNGIYNEVFVSGVVDNPNYSSRVWWSAINDPLYFPDRNYAEVGSNDTAIVGLTKVGDYLAVIKQSKSTDTAIYLLYPTSFEEETTFAVRQGVQGVGALARYSFNILGDETLFLSPKGVMAIVPSQDEEHKAQNRSYFMDGRMLKEENIKSAFSFVYDGKYFLSVPSNENRVYVLDGNQRNSWGNDRTNLVYECYYLENVPAKTFAKFNDRLVFEDGTNVCNFNDGYADAYNANGETDVPVYAEWSTVLDDDGSVHYYKTMQKKGNVVSILPKEIETPYIKVTITEEEYEEDPSKYFIRVGENYIKCTDLEYDESAEYYIENRTNTKVLVKKDGDKPVQIERTFSLSSDIPSEMMLKKKFKKYKRIQFIIVNDAPEPFGIDSIVKNYTLGNYAKK